ncbi:Transcription factor IIIA [Glycine max]|uniref:Transcription factor IIIA isoform B n=1 Tax=Glycine soja TaxID=3848 RepID=A0A445LVR0_GLYSO|nr:Transcription factor IIIA [Glycine max]RZC27303.1 Transcription factor IIIA isoform B [Glycine soja]
MCEAVEIEERPKYKDIRRYYCEYCGICRSKKTLITSHINLHHKEEYEKARAKRDPEAEASKSNTCEECGATFKKHAYLLQHMQSHSLEHWIPEKDLQNARGSIYGLDGLVSVSGFNSILWWFQRPFVCAVDDCQASYRRKDHLTRHLLQHEGKIFKCPVENCNSEFSLQSNMKRHTEEIHDDSSTTTSSDKSHKQHMCPEIGCGKVFRYASQLQKHEDSHVNLESVDMVCLEPGCLKHFTNVQCLQAHVKSSHQYMTCDICGTKQLKKNIKRHLRSHEAEGSSSETFQCEFKGCSCTFSRKSNLDKHKKAVHLNVKPFACGFPDCGMRFAYKHVRDNHEKTAKHVFTLGDFEEADEEFRSRPRGGRKRTCPTVEVLIRKRVTPPSQLEHWLFMQDSE